jgi:hypothetical protein
MSRSTSAPALVRQKNRRASFADRIACAESRGPRAARKAGRSRRSPGAVLFDKADKGLIDVSRFDIAPCWSRPVRRVSVPHDYVLPIELLEHGATNSVTLQQQAAVSLGHFLLLWQTNWPSRWIRRLPAHTANGAPTRCRGCSVPTSRSSAHDMRARMPPGWSGSWTAGTTPRASRGFSVSLSVKIAATSSKAREALARYIARPPVSLK